ARDLSDDDVRAFRRALRGSGVRRTAAHDSYLINLASPDEALYRKSIEAFVDELRRAERLGLHYLVTHPGAHTGAGEEAGLARVRLFHVNDSLKPRGSRVDRHAHVGRGQLGLEPFRLLVNDPRFRARPMVLETPKEDETGADMDAVNLATLRGLVEGERGA